MFYKGCYGEFNLELFFIFFIFVHKNSHKVVVFCGRSLSAYGVIKKRWSDPPTQDRSVFFTEKLFFGTGSNTGEVENMQQCNLPC